MLRFGCHFECGRSVYEFFESDVEALADKVFEGGWKAETARRRGVQRWRELEWAAKTAEERTRVAEARMREHLMRKEEMANCMNGMLDRDE